MRRLLWFHHGPPALLLLLPLLLLVVGFTSGARMNADEASQAASSDPEVEKLLSYPTVEASADYEQASDSWHVVLTEEDSQMQVAELWVVDDTGEPENVEIFAPVEALDAVKVASLTPAVRQELAKYDSPDFAYAAQDEDEGDWWKVDFVVEDSNPTAGEMFESGDKKAVARVGINIQDNAVTYVFIGDQVGWQLARGGNIFGRQANYPYIWGILGFVFALGFMRTDKVLSIRNLDVLALLSFLASHIFFRAADVQWAVLLWYPPLLYLLARTFLMGFGYGERVEKTSELPITAMRFQVAARSPWRVA